MRGTEHGSGSSGARLGSSALALFAVAAVLAACAAPGAGSSNPPATGAAPSSPPASAAGAVKLEARTDATYGTVVTGAGGMSLYVFLNDTGGKSTCYGDCLDSWPALIVASASDVIPGSGVTGGLGTTNRDGGAIQVTLGGAPLYYFTGDTTAGATTGQGLNDVWYLASPAGTAVGIEGGASPDPAAPSPTICTGRSCY